MKTNEMLQKDVQDAIKWEPLLNAAEIGVTAKDGVITLTGIVDSYTKKIEAEDAAKNTAGVKAVVEKIEIKYNGSWQKGDNEIAIEVVKALKERWDVPHEKIKVKVEDGWVVLEGAVSWDYQRESAKAAIRHIFGIKGITSNIKIKAEIQEAIEKRDLENALSRSWAICSQEVRVKVAGTKVTLTGTVSSLYQKEEAGRIAWNTPGVWAVENELHIEYAHELVD